MKRKPDVAIVGPGRLGAVIARELKDAGYVVAEIVCRSRTQSIRQARSLARRVRARAIEIGSNLSAHVVWICVPDSEIARVAQLLSQDGEWKGRVVFHSSGALPASELKSFRSLGASVAAVHPLMTFVSGSATKLKDVSFALEGDRRAVRIAQTMVHDIGGRGVLIEAKAKAAYHTWGAFASPLLIALVATAEQVASQAGVSTAAARRRMRPILVQTLRNYIQVGPQKAFTGPLVRGDVETIRKHLSALKSLPEALAVYKALAKSSLKHLPVGNRQDVADALGVRWK
jgi:predicted short-subunit dehydrogenase-like oxidoreductase (DUF2520 family)